MIADQLTPTRLSRAGRICFWGGIIGVVQALVLLVVSPVVSEQRYSFPFDAGGHALAQATFAVQHLMLVAGVVALLTFAGTSAAARWGLYTAAAGLIVLTGLELYAITLATAPVTDPRADLLNALYGIPTILTGAGLLVGGSGLARSRALTGWRRWITLATGAYVFVALLPAIFGSFTVGRIAIGVWMILFALLGVALSPRRSPAPR